MHISNNRPNHRRRLCITLLAAALSVVTASPGAFAQTVAAAHSFHIASGSLAQVLNQFTGQSGLQVLYDPSLIQGRTAAGYDGTASPGAVLDALLKDTGLVYQFTDAGTVVIKQAPPDPSRRSAKPVPATSHAADKKAEPATLQTVTVTGTRIRGGVTASPTISIDAQQIKQEGFHDLGEVIRSIPQNFSGGQNPGVAGDAAIGSIANQNITGSSALNLRGLGPDATLSLLNGRRLSYDGFVQAVDISAIPIDAVERIEIIPDGASAIYGSDAVAGVANVILKRDFDGVTVGARYGRASSGGFGMHEYTATAGTTWSSGGLIATYKKASQDPIFSDQRDYTRSMDEPTTIYNGSDLRSGLVSTYQLFGDVAKLQVDMLRTDRDNTQFGAYPGLYYLVEGHTSVSQVSPSMEFSLPADWTLTAGGTYGKDESITKAYYVADGASSDLQSDSCYCNKSHSYEVGAEGPVLALGGGDARLAVGVGSRTNEFLTHSFLSGSRRGSKEQSRFGYAELSLPVIGPASETRGVHRLEFSAAVRSEDYDSFGRVMTPKLGLIYGPSADFTLKATWGKSFKAPTLLQRYSTRETYLWTASQFGGTGYPADATVLQSYGGNPDLDPERARTWTTSLAFHPEALPGFEAELTYFDIDYTGRVVQPISNRIQGLSDPNFAQFIQYSPTPEQQAELLANYDEEFINYAGVDYDPSKVVALASNQYINAARQRVKGADLSGSYRFDLGDGRMVLRSATTWLDSSQQDSVGQSAFDLAGTIFNPAKIKSRLGAVWTQGGFSVSGSANYTGRVTSMLAGSADKTASFTTFDATIGYSTSERAGVLSDMDFVLSVDNLLNRDPPLYIPQYASSVPYDSTNYSAIGRYLSLSISKHW